MIAITLAYVIATVMILNANREQLEESKRQYNDEQRIKNMPFLQLEMVNSSSGVIPMISSKLHLYREEIDDIWHFLIIIKNLGYGTAINLVYTWEYGPGKICETDIMPINAIAANDGYVWEVNVESERLEEADNIAINLTLEYRDLLQNSYEQAFSFLLNEESNDGLEIENGDPVYKGTVKYSLSDKERGKTIRTLTQNK